MAIQLRQKNEQNKMIWQILFVKLISSHQVHSPVQASQIQQKSAKLPSLGTAWPIRWQMEYSSESSIAFDRMDLNDYKKRFSNDFGAMKYKKIVPNDFKFIRISEFALIYRSEVRTANNRLEL